jgi:hypothetical protein
MQTIDLIEPEDGSVTVPLQEHRLHPDEDGPFESTGSGDVYAWNNLEIVSVDRSVPKPVPLSWSKIQRGWRSVTYDVILSPSPEFNQDCVHLNAVTKPLVEVWHLFIGTTYYWKVCANRGGEQVAESGTSRFTTNSLPPRWIKVPGTTNVRDLGGWPLPQKKRIRQGMIYRSSELNRNLNITERGRKILEDDLRIRTDLDLRGDHDGGGPALDPEKVQWINVPISPYDCICDAAFRDGYRSIFDTFADPSSYPVLFHCIGGADRGGTVAFLLSALLGKRRELLMRDYELTSLSIWGDRSRASEQFRGLMDALLPFGNDPEDIQEQVEKYVLSLGLSTQAIAAIRDLLIVQD